MFKLLRYFSVSSAIVVVLLAFGGGHFYQWLESRRILSHAHEQNQTILGNIQNAVLATHGAYLSETTETNALALKQSWQTTDIDLSVRQMVLRLPVLKVKIFRPNGILLYSSDLSEVGNNAYKTDPTFQKAIKGAIASERTFRSVFNGIAGRRTNLDVVSTYMPQRGPDGAIQTVFEVYTDVSPIVARMHDEIVRAILLALAACAILYASLYLIVARADRIMSQQYGQLSTFSSRLENEVHARTQHMLLQQEMLGGVLKARAFREGTVEEACALLNESATAMLGVERSSVYVIANKDSLGFKAIDLYDSRTRTHLSGFHNPRPFFQFAISGVEADGIRSTNDVRLIQDIDPDLKAWMKQHNIRATMDVPIYLDGEPIGILCLRQCGKPRAWSAEDRLCAAAIANLAALTFQRDERQKAELSVAESSARLKRQQAILTDLVRDRRSNSGSLKEELELVSKAMTNGLGVERSGLFLLTSDKNAFSYARIYDASKDQFVDAPGTVDFNLRVLELHANTPGTLAVDDVSAHPLLAASYEKFLKPVGIKSMIRAPILIDNELAGVLSCATTSERVSWTPEQTLFATGVANLAALAIERHQRLKAEQQIAADSEMLARHQQALNDLLHSTSLRNGSTSGAMRLLARTLAKEVGVDRVAIVTYGPDGSFPGHAETYIRATDTFEAPFATEGYRPQSLLIKMEVGRLIAAEDARTHPDLSQFYDTLFKAPDIRSLLQIPIDIGGKLFGVINASTCGRNIKWSNTQILFASAIANLAALTVERDNRRRFEYQIADSASRLEVQQSALSEFMSDAAMQSGNLNQALKRLGEITSQTLGIERASFWRLSASKDELVSIDSYDSRTNQHTSGYSLKADGHEAYFKAFLTDGIVCVDDVSTDPRTESFAANYVKSTGVCSMLDMPIVVNGVSVGLVSAEKCGAKVAWSQEHRLFLAAVTGLAALAIERDERQKVEIEVADSAKRLNRQFNVVNTMMNSETVRAGSLIDALKELSRTLGLEMNACRVAIRVVASERNDVNCVEIYNRDEATQALPVGVDVDSTPTAFDPQWYGQHFAVEDVQDNPLLLGRCKDFIEKAKIASAMQVPIRLHGTVTGFVRITTIGRRMLWRPEHMTLATSFAQLAALAIERDNRIRIERNLRHANRAAEQASKAKSQFLANMSHEIRTPMNGVFGMTDLLMQTQLSDRQNRLVGTIHQSAKTLLTIINDILDLSRIESGKLELEVQAFNFRHCLEGVIELFAEEAQRKGINLTLFVAADTPACVLGDAVRLRQICINLVSNALKFTKQGEVALRVTGRALNASRTRLHIEVSDTGIGIDAAVKERLFRPFTQADETITRRFGGTGLGLSISRHLVEMMNGTVRLDSELGRGTVVTLDIPFTVAAEAVDDFTPPNHTALVGQRVLVVDDRESNREIMVDYLTAAGVDAVQARNAETAIDLLAAAADGPKPFNAAVVDMLMPEINGLELSQIIRSDQRMAKLGLVMVTSMSWNGDTRDAKAMGISHLLTKPIRRGDLLDAVSQSIRVGGRTSVASSLPSRTVETKLLGLNPHALLAEDNPINEEVAREFLTTLGCTVVSASDGIQAVKAFENGAFDIVLMDCQMPEMDGLTATRHIRAFEKTNARRRTPVVAVTANAYAEDRLSCLAAGMDDYMSKPFNERQLADMLTLWLTSKTSSAPFLTLEAQKDIPMASPAAPVTTADLDETVLDQIGKTRPQLVARLLRTYLNHSPKMVEQLCRAAADGNADALRLAAHSLKSSSANVGARRISELARQLEKLGSSNEVAVARGIADDLAAEFAAVSAVFSKRLESA